MEESEQDQESSLTWSLSFSVSMLLCDLDGFEVWSETFCHSAMTLLDYLKQWSRRGVFWRVWTRSWLARGLAVWRCPSVVSFNQTKQARTSCSSLNQQVHLQITCLHLLPCCNRHQPRHHRVTSERSCCVLFSVSRALLQIRLTLEDVYSISQPRSFTTIGAAVAVVAKSNALKLTRHFSQTTNAPFNTCCVSLGSHRGFLLDRASITSVSSITMHQ